MNYKHIVIMLLLFGATLDVFAENLHIQGIIIKDKLEIKEDVVITKWSDYTNTPETFYAIPKITV